jgi:hypothetical protein
VLNENERMNNVGEVVRDAKLCLMASSSLGWLSKMEGYEVHDTQRTCNCEFYYKTLLEL